MKKNSGNKRTHVEITNMELEVQSSSKRTKIDSQEKNIIDLEEESINQSGQVGPIIIENEVEMDVSSLEETISRSTYETQRSQVVLKIQQYSFSDAQHPQPKSKDLIIQYAQARKESLEENKKFLLEIRKLSQEKVSLITVKEAKHITLNIAVEEEDKVSEIKIMMDQLNVLDKVNFHKKMSGVLYSDLLYSTLSTKKLQEKVEKLEWQLRKRKSMSKSWQTQVKKMEEDLLEKGIQPGKKHSINKFVITWIVVQVA